MLQCSLFKSLLVALDAITDLEIVPALETYTTLGILAHLLDILLLVPQRRNFACDRC
jgi:hypothetical protein